MERFSIKEGCWEGYNILTFIDNVTGCSADITLRGATLLKFNAYHDGKLINIIDGYQTGKEFAELSGARCCMMAPFSNRIKSGIYSFNGNKYQLINPVDQNKEPIHGLLRTLILRPVKTTISEEAIKITLFADEIRPGVFAGYPFALDIYVTITFSVNKMEFEITGENAGDTSLPFGAGWHPYFKTSEEGIDDVEIQVPFNKYIEVDESLVPLDGDKAYKLINENSELDYRNMKRIGEQQVNVCYCDGIKSNNGEIITQLHDPSTGIRINVKQEEGVMYIYTADGVKYRPRHSVAAEPVQFISNSYNRVELLEELTVKPGEKSTFSFGFTVE